LVFDEIVADALTSFCGVGGFEIDGVEFSPKINLNLS
jgi:hypothetical protein